MGATCYCNVDRKLWWRWLHELEYEPDVHVLEVDDILSSSHFMVTLRSDKFPGEWTGKVLRCQLDSNKPHGERVRWFPKAESVK